MELNSALNSANSSVNTLVYYKKKWVISIYDLHFTL